MGKELAEKYPAARAVFDERTKRWAFDLKDLLCRLGGRAQAHGQHAAAILTCSVAVHRVLAEKGLQPDFVAGHSLGEYSALVAAGFAEVCRCGPARAEARDVYAGSGSRGRRRDGRDHGIVPRGGGRCLQTRGGGRSLWGGEPEFAGPDGDFGACECGKGAVELASQAGAKRAVILPVSAPFHSALMMPAQEKLEKELRNTGFSNLRVPLVTMWMRTRLKPARKRARR